LSTGFPLVTKQKSYMFFSWCYVVAIAALPYLNSSQAFKHSDQFNCSPVRHSQSISCSETSLVAVHFWYFHFQSQPHVYVASAPQTHKCA